LVTYLGRGAFRTSQRLHSVSCVGLICGGTGLTPAFQVVQEALRDSQDDTRFYLLLATRTEDDILLRTELDEWTLRYPRRFKVPDSAMPRRARLLRPPPA